MGGSVGEPDSLSPEAALGWAGLWQSQTHCPRLACPQALFREAGTVAGNTSHALGWSPATGRTTGTTGAGLLGDLPAGRELTARPPRGPRLSAQCAPPSSASPPLETIPSPDSSAGCGLGMEPSAKAAVPIPLPPDPGLTCLSPHAGCPQPPSASGPQVTRLHTHGRSLCPALPPFPGANPTCLCMS